MEMFDELRITRFVTDGEQIAEMCEKLDRKGAEVEFMEAQLWFADVSARLEKASSVDPDLRNNGTAPAGGSSPCSRRGAPTRSGCSPHTGPTNDVYATTTGGRARRQDWPRIKHIRAFAGLVHTTLGL